MRAAPAAAQRMARAAACCACMALGAPPAVAAAGYTPIVPAMADRTVTLTGRELTIDQIVMIARHGAKVALADEARRREADNYGLLLEACAEGIPVYWFNRGSGDQRETVARILAEAGFKPVFAGG